MKIFSILLLSLLCSFAYAEMSREELMESLVQGNYFLIGKSIGNKTTFYGHVSIKKDKPGLKVIRTISGKVVKGTAAIEHATPDKVPVLRIRFNDGGYEHEQTCMVGSDLDNHARITCTHYLLNVQSMEPGFEALFINYNNPNA